MIQPSDRPTQCPGYLAQTFDGELVLYHPERPEALCLNKTAALVWSLCDGENSVAEIQKVLSEVFEEAGDISEDVQSALERMHHDQCIQLNE